MGGPLRLYDWFVVAVTDEGPSRILGTQTFPSYGQAVAAADKWLSERPVGHVACVCAAVENRWRDPMVRILSDDPQTA